MALDPLQVQEINRKRAEAVDAGADPYASDLRNYSTFDQANPMPPVNVVSADQLGAPQTPLKTTPPVAPTSSSGLSAETEALAKSAQASMQAEADNLKNKVAEEGNQAATLMERLGFSSKDKTAAYESEGVNNTKKEIDTLTSQMEAGNLNARRQIEKINEQNDKGLYGAGAQGEIGRIERKNASYQADLAIVLAAKTKQYDTAKAIIDRRVDADTEQIKAELDAVKFFYSENKDQLNKTDQRLYEDRIKKEEREYEAKRDERKLIGEIQLEAAKNSAPPSVVSKIGSATTQQEALSAATGYVKPTGSNSTSKLSLAEARAAGLPVSLVGRSEQDVVDDLQKPLPPAWYVEKAKAEFGQDISDEDLKLSWDEFKVTVNQ